MGRNRSRVRPGPALRTAEIAAWRREVEESVDGPVTATDLVPAGVAAVYPAGELAQVFAARRSWAHIERQVVERRRALVTDARGRGVSWDGVGWLLGTSGEAARQRFGAS